MEIYSATIIKAIMPVGGGGEKKKKPKQFWDSLSMKPNFHLKDKSTFLFWSQNWISGISFLNRILIDFILVVLSYFIMFVLNQIPLST